MKAPYNPDRFDRAVDHYVAARLTYAPKLIAWLAEDTGTEGRAVLDLGCGPGFIANAIAPFAAEVVGLDPSPNMIAAARAVAAPNARFEVGSSEDLSAVPGELQLVTMGRSFHWMDRAETLRELDQIVTPDGAIALLNDRPLDAPMNRWWHAYNAVSRSFAVRDAYGAHRTSPDWAPHPEVLIQSQFSDLRTITVFQTHTWTLTQLVRHTYSRSATTEELLGDTRAAFEAAVEEALAPYGPGPWTSLNEHTALIARRAEAAQ